MKNLTLFFLFAVYISCSETSEGFPPLDDYHSLSSISCECAPIKIVPFQEQWKFDFINSEVTVRTFGDGMIDHLFVEGVYAIVYDTISNANEDLLKIKGRTFGVRIEDGAIFLDSGSLSGIADLPFYVFIKN